MNKKPFVDDRKLDTHTHKKKKAVPSRCSNYDSATNQSNNQYLFSCSSVCSHVLTTYFNIFKNLEYCLHIQVVNTFIFSQTATLWFVILLPAFIWSWLLCTSVTPIGTCTNKEKSRTTILHICYNIKICSVIGQAIDF